LREGKRETKRKEKSFQDRVAWPAVRRRGGGEKKKLLGGRGEEGEKKKKKKSGPVSAARSPPPAGKKDEKGRKGNVPDLSNKGRRKRAKRGRCYPS